MAMGARLIVIDWNRDGFAVDGVHEADADAV